jgi:hypothetical protein
MRGILNLGRALFVAFCAVYFTKAIGGSDYIAIAVGIGMVLGSLWNDGHEARMKAIRDRDIARQERIRDAVAIRAALQEFDNQTREEDRR